MSAVFSRVRGSSGFLLLLAFLRFGRGGWGVGLSGGFSGSGLGAPGSCSLWGWGSGAPGAPGSCVFVRGLGACVRLVLASLVLGGGGWVRLCVWFILGMRFPGVGRAARLFFGGWVCLVSCFVFAVVLVVFAGGFRVFLFPLGASFLWFGGCRVGLGLFFSGCCARSGFGLVPCWGLARVRVWVWFCLESLILAQDERWRRA